ncbi:MAG: succinate dehydrogenase cytochrome b subunit [Aureispira sp.]|nr:succinate dehydrogenase cytochrome b subunit [Aureispira sp.]
MKWLTNFLVSSLGRKLIMSLTGLFLCLFLVVHMLGNLQLFVDSGETFNAYAYTMTHNPLIKLISYGNYFFILLHAIQGIAIYLYNKKARGSEKYAGKEKSKTAASTSSRNMAIFGSLIFFFIAVHMAQFWGKMHFTDMPVDALGHKDLYLIVSEAFQQEWVVIFYLLGLVALAFHLMHGFWSAFQSLGLSHKKYSPIIRAVGMAYAILIPLGFAAMPIYFYVLPMMK